MSDKGIPARKIAPPRVNYIRETVNRDQFTDGGSTVGTYQMQGAIPVGAYTLGTRVITKRAFTGDTTAAATIGDGSDVDRYNTSTLDLAAAASAAGVDAGVPSGAKMHTAAVRPTITITSTADFTNVADGQVFVEIAFLEFSQ